MQALLGYGTSSGSDGDSSDSSSSPKKEEPKATMEPNKPRLPKPLLNGEKLQTSVFANPYMEAELAKDAILERHVKMVPGTKDTQMINGKRICWNYRKGRCRFGHKCRYAHDSDIQKTPEQLIEEQKRVNAAQTTSSNQGVTASGAMASGATATGAPPLAAIASGAPPSSAMASRAKSSVVPGSTEVDDDDAWDKPSKYKRKRPGLCQTLVPSRKILRAQRQQRLKDAVYSQIH